MGSRRIYSGCSASGSAASSAQQLGDIPRHVHDPQDRTVRVRGIVGAPIVEALHRPELEPAGQELEPPVPTQRMADDPLGSIRNRDGELFGEHGTGNTCGDVVSRLVDVPKRLRGEIFRPHTAAP